MENLTKQTDIELLVYLLKVSFTPARPCCHHVLGTSFSKYKNVFSAQADNICLWKNNVPNRIVCFQYRQRRWSDNVRDVGNIYRDNHSSANNVDNIYNNLKVDTEMAIWVIVDHVKLTLFARKLTLFFHRMLST